MEHICGCFRRAKSGKRSKQRQAYLPPMPPPWLPAERPRPLTAIAGSPAATADSRFFQCLPAEIRHRILVEAFGERTLHLDLRLEHPLKEDGGIANARPKRHANAQLFHPSLRDNTRRQEWTWWSCVCHRRSPSSDFRPHPPGVGLRSEEPALDCCCNPSGLPPYNCELYPGNLPDKCLIGVIGWLLVCRQAYVEGIYVLYSTNRFHIANAELAFSLPELLPSQHVAAIKEVELSWDFHAARDEPFAWDAHGVDRFWQTSGLALLERLPESLPNLRYMYLSVKDILCTREPPWPIGGREMYEATEDFLRSIDAVIRRMSRLRECRIALPSTLYSTRKLVEKSQDIDWHRGNHWEPESLWRSLPITDESTDLATGHRPIGGYWIVHGHEDMDPPPMPEVV
ncbi:hypothetical protein F4776DRAFT_465250 [Hypoxylon sp. NC0597]|nr:hypothetical protein F4776DRAFT_465250 [Hypoxylon sp. NC0597]